MFTAEIRINGGLIAILHAHNLGISGLTDKTHLLYRYEYEYFEPSVGIRKEIDDLTPHIQGSVICRKNLGIRHVMQKIFQDINKQ